MLRAAAGVVVTSEWTRRQVLTRYAIPACRVHVARPGVDPVAAPARPVRGHLICVGVLGRHKGQDLLVEALADLADRDWHCVLAGSLDRDPDFAGQLRARITRLGYGHRVRLSGVLTGAALSHAYTTADLLVAPSRAETYGMTVTEALAHGLPVIAAAVGGLPEALGSTADGTRPGQLIPPGDPAALAAALGLAGRRAPPAPATSRRPTAAVDPARLGADHARDSERTDRHEPGWRQACAAPRVKNQWKVPPDDIQDREPHNNRQQRPRSVGVPL